MNSHLTLLPCISRSDVGYTASELGWIDTTDGDEGSDGVPLAWRGAELHRAGRGVEQQQKQLQSNYRNHPDSRYHSNHHFWTCAGYLVWVLESLSWRCPSPTRLNVTECMQRHLSTTWSIIASNQTATADSSPMRELPRDRPRPKSRLRTSQKA